MRADGIVRTDSVRQAVDTLEGIVQELTIRRKAAAELLAAARREYEVLDVQLRNAAAAKGWTEDLYQFLSTDTPFDHSVIRPE